MVDDPNTFIPPPAPSQEEVPSNVAKLNVQAANLAQAIAAGTADASMVMYLAVNIMVSGMTGLNSFLKQFSDTVLATDLNQDQYYANQLSRIKLNTNIPEGTGAQASQERKVISAQNENLLQQQQVLQARLKTHQNQEQLDIQTASTTTSNMQQLASVVSSLLDMLSQIFGSVNTLNR